MAVQLTDRTLRSLLATTVQRRDVWDELLPGFGARLSPGGHCAFVVRYRISGRQRRLTLGPYPRTTLADARQRAREALRAADRGEDAAAAKIEARKAETFADLAELYVERHASQKKSGGEDRRILYGSPHKKRTGKTPHVPLVKRWGPLKVKDITRRDVRELLDETANRAPIMANRILALVRKMFNFAIEHEWRESNPCHMIKRAAPERQRDRVLNQEEIRAVWNALDYEHLVVASCLRLRLLTAQRGGEVLGAAWNEFDLEGGWWTIPAARSKNGLAHRVPLSVPALSILKSLREQTGASAWLFPSPKKTAEVLEKPIAHIQKAIERVVTRSQVRFRGHDLRRTAASLMVGAGVPRLVVSKILNHVETGVTAVYDRHGYDPEKRAALDLWAQRLTAIIQAADDNQLQPFEQSVAE